MDPTPYSNSAASNNNGNVTWKDNSGGNFLLGGRVLKSSHPIGTAASPFVIPSGVYNFCEIDFSQDVYMAIPAGAHVVIYIDSPYRAGSGCANNTGDVNVTGNFAFINRTGDPSNLEIDAWGNPGAAQPNQQPIFKFTNNLNAAGTPTIANFFAPYSQVIFTNTVSMAGSIVGGSITSNNTTTFSGSGGGAANGNPSDTYYPIAWHQCPSDWSASDPASGCSS
jgi:hypothetical protein